ncbi:MAG: reprolysin-like metallopeptidase [Fimbriimonadaceae bacterium]
MRGLISLAILAGAVFGSAQDYFSPSLVPVNESQHPALPYTLHYQAYNVNAKGLKTFLSNAPLQDLKSFSKFKVVSLPMPDGSLQRFKVASSPILTPELANKIDIKTYKVVGIDDIYATGRIDVGLMGFHGYIQGAKGDIVIDPPTPGNQDTVVVYKRSDNLQPRSFSCNPIGESQRSNRGGALAASNGTFMKTYRLAMKATGEYTAFFGGTAAQGQAAIVVSINRINQVYEAELAIHLTIVNNVAYTNPATDPYTNNNGNAMLGENQTTCNANPGSANYDIGHVFSTGGGGIAGLGVVGGPNKAWGVTGGPAPVGDAFDIDYVAHEMGHQFNGNHTFANCSGSAGPLPYEMFSGSTIMAYAGICSNNVQPNSDAYFHLVNLLEITPFSDGNGSGTTTANGNLLPVVNAGLDYTVPAGTPVKFTASATDGNGDPLKYCWEIWQTGNNTATGASHRSRNPSTSPSRFVPPLSNVINNTTDSYDPLFSARTARWRVTARDNRAGGGGYGWDEMTLTVAGAAFSVTAPNTAVSWPGGSTQTVTWAVGGSGGTANVRILLSTDGGNSYGTGGTTVLLASTPNDGSETITVPNISTTTARIIVEGVNNIFYDMSNANFTITPVLLPTVTSISPTFGYTGGSLFNLTVNGTNFVNGTSTVRWNGSNRTTTFVNATQLTAAIPATDLNTIGLFPITVANGANISNAVNFQVRSIVAPGSFSVLTGTLLGGGLPELLSSNNAYLRVRPSFAGARLDPNVLVETTHACPVASPSSLIFTAELNATAGPNDFKLQAFNNTSGLWEDLATGITSTTDTTYSQTVSTSTSRFISAGSIRVRCWVRAQSANGSRSWEVQHDLVTVEIRP